MKKLPLVAALLGVVLVLSMQFVSTPYKDLYEHAPSLTAKPDYSELIANAVPIMQICISALVLGAGLWVILSRQYQPTEKHWAYGAIGTIIGFWLRR